MTNCHFTFGRSSDSIVGVVGTSGFCTGTSDGRRGKLPLPANSCHSHVIPWARLMPEQLQCFKERRMHMGFLCIRLILLYSTVCMHALATYVHSGGGTWPRQCGQDFCSHTMVAHGFTGFPNTSERTEGS